jgi:hypothetical protein
VTWNNNIIVTTAPMNWYKIQGMLNTSGATISMTNNDFGDGTIQCNNNGSATVVFDLNCNNSNLDSCPGVVTGTNNTVTISYADTPTWTLGYGSCAALGAITDQEACVFDGIAYVKFSVHHPLGYEPSMTVSARWGDDDCSTGYSDEVATYDSVTNEWFASFDVSGISDGSFYWKGMSALCSTTGSGTCQIRTTRDCNGSHDPWVPTEGR